MSAGVAHGRRGSRHGPRLDREAGFTLLEIVVALVVLGILLVTLTRGVQFGLAAYDRQDGMVATAGRLEAVDRTLRRLITLLDPGTPTDGDSVVGVHHALAFRAPLPPAAAAHATGVPADGLSDLRLSVDDRHRLVLAWLPHRHVLPTGPAPAPHETVLLDDVERIDIDYWGDNVWHQQWHAPRPPALIRIRIVFPDGDPRRWPDIVAAPVREQVSG